MYIITPQKLIQTLNHGNNYFNMIWWGLAILGGIILVVILLIRFPGLIEGLGEVLNALSDIDFND